MLLHNLKMAWWNVALSHAKATTKPSIDSYSVVCNHLKRLFTEFSCDLISVCEVSTEDIAYISSNLNLINIEVLDLTHATGNTRFDMAVIYNNKKLNVRHEYTLSKLITGQTIKAAQLVEIENLDDRKKFKLFLCHWASRIHSDGQARRNASAEMVYNAAKEYMESSDDVIVMGDFNDNPYDESILNRLKATRCHDAVRKYPKEYFYNPFWRSIVSAEQYSHLNNANTYRSGSYKYSKQLAGPQWHSFDQIIFSGSFLGTSTWHLNEQQTSVIIDPSLIEDFDNRKNKIDHLPIIGEITRP